MSPRLGRAEGLDCENEVNIRCCYWNPDNFLWQLKNPDPWPIRLTVPGKPGLWDLDDHIYHQLHSEATM